MTTATADGGGGRPAPPTGPLTGLVGRRGPMVLSPETAPTRLWSLLFVTRHVVIAGLGVAVALMPEFGDDRLLISAVLVFAVLPYDVGVHVYARRHRHLPVTMPFVYAPLPALFVVAFPETWIPALIAAMGNVVLFAITFELRVALGSAVVSAACFLGAVPLADPVMGRSGAVVFGIVVPAVVLGVGALLETVQLSEERYRDYVENATDMIYVHDLNGVFMSANETALRVTGYTRDELGHRNVADIVAPEFLEEAIEGMHQAVVTGSPESETIPWELEIVTRDGRRLPVEIKSRVIFQRGKPVAIQGIARDISDRRQVEAGREALDRARSEFIANAAHELRTPLTTLAGLASVLANNRDATTDDDLVGGLEALARQGRRVQVLADRLLDLSLMDLGGIDVELAPVETAQVVEHALEDAPPPEGKRVEVSVDAGARAVTDAVRLQEIVANLLANAYRYGGEHVSVRAIRVDGHLELSVEDDGPGVAPDLVPRLFEPFTRGDERGGTGLGLAISRRLAEALGGELAYEPRRPRGARFSLRLPAAS